MSQNSGFFNAFKSGTVYSPKYNANDFSDNLAAIISTGVRRSGNDDLRVTSAGGMALAVAIGRAWINGRWYVNDAVYNELSVPTAPTGDRARIDRVVLRLTIEGNTQNILLAYLTGEVSVSPTAPALTRTESVYEIALADIYVDALVTSITQANITDQRGNKDVCGWITTPVGYDDYFTSLDNEFNDWFEDKKETLTSVTLFKRYHWRTTIETETSIVTFNIPQYDPTGVDILDVYVNGLLSIINVEYTVSGSIITFTNPKIADTEIDVFVYKSIDGTGLGSVSDEITELQNEVATLKNIGDYIYICNGVDDNIQLSNIAQDFLENDTDYDQLTISVYGTFGASTPYGGLGTSVSRYRWFSLGGAGTTKKKVVFDFQNCSKISLNCLSGYYYIGFYGTGVNIKNANVEAQCNHSTSGFVMFSATNTALYAENCRFFVTGYSGCSIAQTGTFTNCKANVYNSNGDSYVFNVSNTGLLRVNGGEYYAYTGLGTSAAAVVFIDSTASSAVAITQGMNCPTVEESARYQKNAVRCLAGRGGFNDTITTLTVEAVSTQNVRGIITVSKPDRT
nr:MAG TPA: Receptor Binding Protein [Bacteriophage sp.]